MRYAARIGGLLSLGVAVTLGGCSLITLDLQPRVRPLVEETVDGSGSEKILLVDLSGLLADETPGLTLGTPPPRVPLLARVREELGKAEKDEHVRAVILRINSPGGTITASDVLHREIRTFKARRKIPVIAALMDVAASGGYYVALAADTIVAHPTTVTGSIGVIMLTVNAQGLMEKIGVSTVAIKSGDRKDAGSPFRALTAEERAMFQSVIDDMQHRFVRLVAESRRLPEARVAAAADGSIYTAAQARALGLIDRVAYMDEVLDLTREAAGLREARVVMYHRPRDYRATYYAATPAGGGAEQTLAYLAAMVAGAGPRFLYLWWP